MKQPQSITALAESPDAERRRRMTKYFIAMAVRVGCIMLCFFLHGWWLLLPIVGAVVLPYVAVVFANIGSTGSENVLRPGAVVPVRRGIDPAGE